MNDYHKQSHFVTSAEGGNVFSFVGLLVCLWLLTKLLKMFRWTDSLGWKIIILIIKILIYYYHQNTTKLIYIKWRFRPLEAYIRRTWYSVLPILDTTGRCRVKKAVVSVTELIAALVPIYGVLAFLADMYNLFDLPGKALRLIVDRFLDMASSSHIKNRNNFGD